MYQCEDLCNWRVTGEGQREQDSPVSPLAAASCSVPKSLRCEETSFVGAVSGALTIV